MQKLKIELNEMILAIENEAVLEKIISVVRSEEADFCGILPKAQKADLELGITQADNGQTISLEDVIKKVS